MAKGKAKRSGDVKVKVKWRKGWEVVDEAKGGYAETAYECFDLVPDIPLLKSKTGGNMAYREFEKRRKAFVG